MFLCDTDHLSILQRRTQPEHARLAARLLQHPEEAFFTPIISFHEQASGWIAYISNARDSVGKIRGYQMLEHLIADFGTARIAHFDAAVSQLFDSLRAQRVRIATMDLRIAATALSNNFTLLSRNIAHFRLVPGLRVEDWTV